MTSIVVNGRSHDVGDPPQERLLDWLRGPLDLKGAKPGCGEGQCGACTVLIDGTPAFSCRTSVGEVDGRSVTTVEGLATAGSLHRVQQAILDEGAAQCGYCTPGMVVRAAALLATTPDPDEDAIKDALDPNLCRCGGYLRIVRAVRRAATLTEGAPLPDHPAPELTVGAADLPEVALPWDLCPPEARDYFEVLGPGLVCVAGPAPGRELPSHGGAWLHVGVSGVTAFSGKVNVGQDNTTAFRMLVAEELDVGLDAVRVVQGDTDVCPFDPGTFGSRSMPDAGQPLRWAAAGARQTLLQLAADRWNVPTTSLHTAQGSVHGGPEGADLAYRDIVAGLERVEIITDEPILHGAKERRLVGTPQRASLVGQPKPGPFELVTGLRRYGSDLSRPGMGYGAVLRPPVPESRLVSLDTSPARSLPGVTVVEDGTFVGAIAASSVAAHAAVEAMAAHWELPPPLDAELPAYLRAHPAEGSGWQGPFDDAVGDVAGEQARAETQLEATYTTAYIAHVPLETRAALAEWVGDRLTIHLTTQVPFGIRRQLAEALGLDQAQVRVIVPPTGGAFGGKHGGEVALDAARLARAANRPVLVHWSRAEEFGWGWVRPMAVIDIRAGADLDGNLRSWDFLNVNAGTPGIGLPYRVSARRLRYQPADSPLRQGSYRALAATANNFARESAIDELAHAAKKDPVAFRLAQLADDRLAAVLRAAADSFGWSDDLPRGAGTGWGVAVGMEKGGRVATCVEVTVQERRLRVQRVVTAYDCGTIVNPDTVRNQIEGAMIMSLGGALYEAVRVDPDRRSVRLLADYRVPRFADLPAVEVVLLDRPDLPSAGAGETPMIGLAPAVANAIFCATGVRLRNLPLTPDGLVPSKPSP